ncbi:unnamed protein product [Parnassius mnemosyne]|uniref:Connectin n=1 Tax=Parnassius mnemosyne TaxID=213953 RepID=A0AAV1KKB9_9NEOP
MAVCRIVTLICALILSAEAKFSHNSHHQKRETTSSICDPAFNSTSKIQCYCAKDSSDIVRSAECYPTHENVNLDDPSWSKFNLLKNATKLVLTNTRGISLKYIPSTALKHTENLLKLDVKYGNIEIVESFAFANLSYIEEIALSGNQIEKLSVRAFAHHKMLDTISLDSNNIIEINRDVFFDLPSLEKLFLTNNKITTIHDRAFIHLKNLKELEIDRNKLFSLNSETFSGLRELMKLDLSGNSLEVIGDNTFKPLIHLVSLNLDGNKIQMLDTKAFHGLSRLQSLSLSHNELTEIDNVNIFKGLDSLTSLSLKGNRIKELKKAVMAPILINFYGNMSSLNVEDNNFPCDCRLEWFMLLMNKTENANLKLVLENFKCLPDAELRDRWMKRVEADKSTSPVLENEDTAGQGADYEYYDDTELNGRLFYTDVRDLLNCTKTASKTSTVITTVKPQGIESGIVNTKVTASPIFTTTTMKIVTNEHKHDNLVEEILKTTKTPETFKNNDSEVANQAIKENKPNKYTTSRLATVSAKPLEKNHFDDHDMASDEATPDRIKAHRSIQGKSDDYNDLYSNGQSCFVSSFKMMIFINLLNIRFLLY